MRRDPPARTPVRLLAPLAVVVVAIALSVSACGSGDGGRSAGTTTTTKHEFSGYVQSPPARVATVNLPGADGDPVKMMAEPGELLLVYFGYTFCPDVCPTTMAYVKKALSSLPSEDRDRVKVVMVTIDPARDTAAKLTDYLKAFVPDGAAVRTDDQTLLRSATGAFGADYKVTTAADGTIEVSHTGEVYVVDDTGTVVLAWPFGTTPKDIHADLARLLAGDRPQST